MPEMYSLEEVLVRPIDLCLYVPPIVWKGDSIGHVGVNDVFFWVIEGECFLSIDSENYIVKPGQLAYLPKGKMRAYTHASERFKMYEMAFSATSGERNIMDILGLSDDNLVVSISETDKMNKLFENSYRKELHKNPLYDIGWCANIINIIQMYAIQRQKERGNESRVFKPVIDYMAQHYDEVLKTEELAQMVHLQTNYFIKKFKQSYGLPPIAYFNRMKVYKAMSMLAGTNLSIEQISKKVGIDDTSYFARVFKKYCSVTPTQYRGEFRKEEYK